jgi:hypothetical protein
MKNFCIGISCVEDLSNGVNYYTSFVLKSLDNLKKNGDVFIYTNNEDIFNNMGINIIPFNGKILKVCDALTLTDVEKDDLDLDSLYSTHDKLNIIDYVFNNGYTGCLILDADDELTEQSDTIISEFKKQIPNIKPGFHFFGYWNNLYETTDGVYFYPQWGHLKKYEYFNELRKTINFKLNDNMRPVMESNFFVKYFDEWQLFLNHTKKYRNILMKNDLTKFEWDDKKPHRPIGTGEGLTWVITISELKLKRYFHINKLLKKLNISIIRNFYNI